MDLSIENLKNLVANNEYRIYILDKYMIFYPTNLVIQTFMEKWYYGIIFKTEKGEYEVIHNYELGNRLIISLSNRSWKDIPFKSETFNFLPEKVKAIEIR